MPEKRKWKRDWDEGDVELWCDFNRRLSRSHRELQLFRVISSRSQELDMCNPHKPVTGSRTPLREGRENIWWGSPFHRGLEKDACVDHQPTGGITASVLKGGSIIQINHEHSINKLIKESMKNNNLILDRNNINFCSKIYITCFGASCYC